MPDIEQRLTHLQNLCYRLVEAFENVKNEKERLQAELQQVQEEIDGKNHKLELLESELKNARLARGLNPGSPEDTELAKAKISSLVREIDRCIALLNE